MEGTVVRNTGSTYEVEFPDGTLLQCKLKGNFRIKGIRTTNPVAVGDRVEVLLPEGRAETAPQASGPQGAEEFGFITGILPRRNYMIRKASNLSKESHILAANIDSTLLVATLRDPETPLTFIDRFLATAEAYNVPAILVLNKADTWDESDRELAEAVKYLYESIGYPVVFTSTVSGEGLDSLREKVVGQRTLLAGNSGVGKSSLINALIPGLNLKTHRISDIHHTGTHTTTFSQMNKLPGPQGGELIDIPGVKGFGTIDFDPAEVSHYFPEIFRESKGCRYSNCTHTHEPGCAVRQALDDQRISQSRYASYLSIMDDTSEGKYRKPF